MKNASIHFTEAESPLGQITLAATEDGLCGLYFEGQRHWPADSGAWIRDDGPRFDAARLALGRYFSRVETEDGLGIAIAGGTEFQRRVWSALRGIPRGQTWTYGQLAESLGEAKAVRAVGAAVGRNPVSIFIPCHRVIGSSGSLTGYAGGLERKRWLLRHEGAGITR